MFQKIKSRFNIINYNKYNMDDEIARIVNLNLGYHELVPDSGLMVEVNSVMNLTQNGYVGCAMTDISQGEFYNFASGVYLTSQCDILLNGEKLSKTFRRKITERELVIIKADDWSAGIYPFFEDGYDMYMEYNAEDNSIGFVKLKPGRTVSGERIINKFGCCFSQNGQYVFEDAEPNLYGVCSINSLM